MAKFDNIDDPELRATAEIIEYIDQQGGISYYDVKAYALKNQKEDWLAAMRDPRLRKTIALCAREKRKLTGRRYKNTPVETMTALAEAQEEYEKKNPMWFIGDK